MSWTTIFSHPWGCLGAWFANITKALTLLHNPNEYILVFGNYSPPSMKKVKKLDRFF